MKVSVIVTAYNVGEYISQCVKSVLAQSHKDVEVIAVNDCSSDNTLKVLNKIKDERLKVLTNDKNMGVGWSRKRGIESAEGDYVIVVDGDDWLGADFVERLAQVAENTGADIVAGGITHVNSGLYEEIHRYFPSQAKEMHKFVGYLNGVNPSINNKMVRRELYAQVPYCTRRYCDDAAVMLPLLYCANQVITVDTQGYFYRQHEHNMSRKASQFEVALFRLLCARDVLLFFADKGEEYQGLISIDDIKRYKAVLQATMTSEMEEKYCKELGQLVRLLLVV